MPHMHGRPPRKPRHASYLLVVGDWSLYVSNVRFLTSNAYGELRVRRVRMASSSTCCTRAQPVDDTAVQAGHVDALKATTRTRMGVGGQLARARTSSAPSA